MSFTRERELREGRREGDGMFGKARTSSSPPSLPVFSDL
jgi:hypothetical protein